MWVQELSMVVDFTGEVRIVLFRRLEYHLKRFSKDYLEPEISIRTLEPSVSLCVAK